MRRTRLLTVCLLLMSGALCRAQRLDIKRYAALREMERWQFDTAEEEFRRRRWDAAITQYGKFLKLYPESESCAFVQLRIGQCEESRRRVNQAIKEYVAVRDYFPDSPEAPYALWSIARAQGKCGEAKKRLEALQKHAQEYPTHPNTAEALWIVSGYYLGEGENQSLGIQQRHRIVDTFPEHRRFKDAVNWLFHHYALTEEAPSRALEIRTKVVSKEQADIDLSNAYGQHAIHCYRSKKRERGKKFLDLCLERLDDFGSRFPGKNVPYCKKRAAYYLGAIGRIEEAIKRYLKYFEEYANDDAGALAFARWLGEIGRTSEAINRWLLYLAKHPENDGRRVEFGRWLEKIGRWEDARDQYRKMANIAASQWEIAQSFHRQKKGKEAIEAYQLVAEDQYNRANVAYFNMGDVYQHVLRDYEKAIRAFVDSNYNMPENLYRVTDCYCAMKKWNNALQQLGEILFIGRNPPRALKYMVYVFEARKGEKDRSRAINTCKRILDQFPKSGESSWAHQHLEDKYDLNYTGGGVKEQK